MAIVGLSPGGFFRRLQRDVVLRGGVVSALASLIALLILAGVTYYFLTERLETRVEEALVARHQTSFSRANEVGEEERRIIQTFRRSLPIRDEGVFAWLDSDGVTFASNVSGLDCREGFYDGWLDTALQSSGDPIPLVVADQVDQSVHDRFLFLAQKREGNCLVFGRSLYEVDAVKDEVLGLFLWLVPLSMLPAILISLRQSVKLRTRLLQLGKAVRDIASGDLEARMPVQGVDDIDRLAMSSNRSFDRLQESVSTMQQLTSVMAHDLRAPLNRVSIPLDEAMRANESGETAVKSLEKVQDGLLDVRSVFDALLRISQIESGRRRANFTEIDLSEIVEKIFEIYQPVVEDAARTLELEIIGVGTSVVKGDADLMIQLLVNLVENATRYTPEGSKIRIGVHRNSSQPELIVQDNGLGLPEKERALVLRRLYRYEKSTGGQSGHGLGLSLVKAIVDLHDGTIALEDADPGLLVRVRIENTGELVPDDGKPTLIDRNRPNASTTSVKSENIFDTNSDISRLV